MTPQLGLETLSMTAAKVIEAFYKYARDTEDTPRQTATRIGVSIKTLRTWLEGQAQPTKRLTLRLAGFTSEPQNSSNLSSVPSTGSMR
jgi:transcriptional regulator with XRE-family HTH domain